MSGEIITGIAMMINPKKGMGWTESFLSLLVVGTVCFLLIKQIEVPGWFIAFATVGGFWMGSQASNYSKKK